MRFYSVCAAAGLALFLAMFAACGGDDDGGVTASPADDPQKAMLEQMVLRLEDLPAGMQDLGDTFTTNEQAAEGAEDTEAALRQLETWGREVGLSRVFLQGPDAPPDSSLLAVQSDASLYEDGQGAGFSLNSDVEASRAADWTPSFPQLEQTEVTEMDGAGIGDDVYWLRVTGLTRDEPQTLMVIDQLAFHLGRVRAFLRVEAEFNPDAPRDSNEGQVRQWGEIVTARAREALAGS